MRALLARMPWGSLAVAGVLAGMFGAQIATARLPVGALLNPTVPDLVARGALNADLVLVCGDWWRLFLAPLLHGSGLHLGLNLVVLVYAGGFLERVLGRWVLAGLLAAGGLAGAVASLVWLPQDRVSIGASGAIMALVAAAVVLSYARPAGGGARGARLLNILVLSLIPYEAGVDYAAHAGGAVAGVVFALGMVLAGPPERDGRLRRGVSQAVVLGFAGSALWGAMQLGVVSTPFDPQARLLTPAAAAALPRTPLGPLRRERVAVPADPRIAYFLARAEFIMGNRPVAEREALAGLRLLRASFDDSIWPGLGWDLKLLLRLVRHEPAGENCRHARDPLLQIALRRAGLCGALPEVSNSPAG